MNLLFVWAVLGRGSGSGRSAALKVFVSVPWSARTSPCGSAVPTSSGTCSAQENLLNERRGFRIDCFLDTCTDKNSMAFPCCVLLGFDVEFCSVSTAPVPCLQSQMNYRMCLFLFVFFLKWIWLS